MGGSLLQRWRHSSPNTFTALQAPLPIFLPSHLQEPTISHPGQALGISAHCRLRTLPGPPSAPVCTQLPLSSLSMLAPELSLDPPQYPQLEVTVAPISQMSKQRLSKGKGLGQGHWSKKPGADLPSLGNQATDPGVTSESPPPNTNPKGARAAPGPLSRPSAGTLVHHRFSPSSHRRFSTSLPAAQPEQFSSCTERPELCSAQAGLTAHTRERLGGCTNDWENSG